MTCYDGLQNLFEEYGYFKEKTISITMSGITGAEKIKQLMTSLRQEAPTSFGGVQVEAVEDYQASTKTRNDGQVETIDFDQADVLKYYLADGSWIAARPSGTEPKIKFYIGTVASTSEEADQKVARFEDSINEYIKE